MYLEYIVGPVIALLLGMKYTAYTAEQQAKRRDEVIAEQILASDTKQSQQMLKILMPVAKSVTKINEQLGL